MARNDHFSAFAATYASYRPTYPAALFAWLADQAPATYGAWDCATGTGQAALSLAEHFAHVFASDVGIGMIEHAVPHPRISYHLAPAEEPPPSITDLDLITVAQALHWFDRDTFFAACEQRLRPGGILAYWGYLLPSITPAVDAVVRHYHDIAVGPHWPPDRGPLLDGYAQIAPPNMERLTAPPFAMTATWTLDQLIGQLDSWSATHRARQATGNDPLAPIVPELRAAWAEAPQRPITWPLPFHAFRKPR
ncbi:class I SAM-dependent methyltransferase [Actomonas aquatica]|uniref:Class I SAM-dependent methyltransferase n=1 Tax=Actomonas aquatica TaxID=2866162 RepID=A0ABZ1CF56_9BACT|nr:class I SAM-dependent methyltransferase [Opitutus sp. WL0086]WRQ89229.1 class I SAM-dependent methyltransferase [Opitutus sp. WL0086]